MRKDEPVTCVDFENAHNPKTNTPMFHIRFDCANESLYAVLFHLTEGEAKDRVKEAPEGEGLEAYVKIHGWFTMTSGWGPVREIR